MKKTLVILRHEIITLVRRFSFWFGVLGIPLIGFLILAGISIINRSQANGNTPPAGFPGIGQIFSPEEDLRPQGYVDQADLIREFASSFDQNEMIAFPEIQLAKDALESEKISAFYVIPSDYIESGTVRMFTKGRNIFQSQSKSEDLAELLRYNLIGQDPEIYQAVSAPIRDVEMVNLAPESGPARDPEGPLTFFVPYIVMMVFFISIMGSSTMLLNSVAKEKENRILEILMVTASPQQILLGKIIGLGLVGLLQVVIWVISGILLMRMGGQTFTQLENFQLEPSILGWGVVFFVLGYIVYASLMAGIGALVPSIREASQATTIVTMPLIVPLFVISALIQSPNSGLSIALSLFPLTAPTTMMLRLSATNVPLWQILLAVVLLVTTALLVIRAVAGMFRAQTLLSGQPFKVKRFFLALIGRV